MFAHLNPHGSGFGDIYALYSPCLHRLTMQSSLFEPGCPAIFTRSTGDQVDATMKGPLEKGELFAVLEYMKGAQVVPHPCAPLHKIDLFIRSLPASQAQRRRLAPLLKFLLNQRSWCSLVQSQGTPQSSRLGLLHQAGFLQLSPP